MKPRRNSKSAKWFLMLLIAGGLVLSGTGCKSKGWNPFSRKAPPLMDGRGMVPPAYSKAAPDGASYQPATTGFEVAPPAPTVPSEEPLPNVGVTPGLSPIVELPPVVEEGESLSYEVKKGDSLWKIARAYGVSHFELAAHNKMDVADPLPVGRILAIPPGGKFVPPAERPRVSPRPSPSPPDGRSDTGTRTPSPGGPRKLNDDGTYTVRSGDSLWLIARDLGCKVNDIRTANSLTTDVLQIGQRLVIPSGGATTAAGAGDTEMTGSEPETGDTETGDATLTTAGNTGTGTTTTGNTGAALPNMLDYTVTQGDTLQNIADMFSIDIDSIKRANPGVKGDADLRPNMNIRIPLN